MSSEIFNPNPTVFVTSKSVRPALQFAKANSLWLDDPEDERDDYSDEEDGKEGEAEAIDQDEIFGMRLSPAYPLLDNCSSKTCVSRRVDQVDIRP